MALSAVRSTNILIVHRTLSLIIIVNFIQHNIHLRKVGTFMLSPEEQVDLTHTEQMVALAEEVQALFPFAYVKTISGLDGMLYDFVGVYYGDNCILTIGQSKLEDVKRFMHEYFLSEIKAHGLTTHDLDILIESKHQKGNTDHD